MPASDLPLLIEAAREAGRIASRYTGESAKRWDKPGGLGPVTEADMAVNEMLERDLRAARSGYGWLSEETEDGAGRLGRDHVFIIDPIDGTRSFIEGSATWAHSLAVAEKGVVTAAVIYLPLRNKFYAAATGQGATLNNAPITVSPRKTLPGAHFMAAKPNLDARNWKGGHVPEVRRSHRPSLAYRLSLVAEGRYDAMLTLRRSWEWDIAAGDLILREAGAVTSDRAGQPLRFNNAEPLLNGVIAANPDLQPSILDALAIG